MIAYTDSTSSKNFAIFFLSLKRNFTNSNQEWHLYYERTTESQLIKIKWKKKKVFFFVLINQSVRERLGRRNSVIEELFANWKSFKLESIPIELINIY